MSIEIDQALTDRLAQARHELEVINICLDAYESGIKDGGQTWAHVGSLGHVVEQLKETAAFMNV